MRAVRRDGLALRSMLLITFGGLTGGVALSSVLPIRCRVSAPQFVQELNPIDGACLWRLRF